MADTVSTITLFNNPRRLIVKLISHIYIYMDYVTDIQGMEVALSVDATTDVVLARLEGNGILDYTFSGGLSTRATGDTGDILLSTNGHSSGDHYDITLHLVKKD